MGHRYAGRGLALGVTLLALLGAGCTPETTTPPPVTSTSATPTESAQEREERVAYEAAEKSYREFRAEVEHVYARGGADKPTAMMKATAGGQYLNSYQEVSEAYRDLKHYSKGQLKIGYVHRGGFSSSELILDVCEDGRSVITFDRRGKKLYTDDLRKLQLKARLVDGAWKIWSGTGEKSTSCD